MYPPVHSSHASEIPAYFDSNPMDPDVFAILIPMDSANLARESFGLPGNSHLYTPIRRKTYTPDSRDRSETPSSDVGLTREDESSNGRFTQTTDEVQTPNLRLDYITLRLSQTLKAPYNGFQVGTRGNSDVCLLRDAAKREPSSHQFNIMVDDEYKIWLHDYYSFKGTAVQYKKFGHNHRRRKETWILSYPPGDKITLGKTSIWIGDMIFAIYFPNHHQTKPTEEYLAKLEAFCKARQESAPSIGDLAIETGSAMTTATSSSVVSRSRRPLYIPHKELGSGGFGNVTAVINGRTGERMAMKKFTGRGFGIDWELLRQDMSLRMHDDNYAKLVAHAQHEFNVAIDLPSHPNIMRPLEFFDDVDGPVLLMPLYEHGDIKTFSRDRGAFGMEQCFVLLLGLLKGLDFLHFHGVVHRDIKGENIMVELNPFNVVLTDFGVSTANTCYSFAGTTPYMAPEVFNQNKEAYAEKADIWSVAVTILSCYFPEYYYPTNIPEFQARTRAMLTWSKEWAEELAAILMEGHLARTGQAGQDALCDMLYSMLEEDPALRYSARQVLDLGCELGQFIRTPNGDYEILQATADLVARGQHTSSQGSPLAPFVEVARSRRSTRQQTPSNQPWSNSTVVPPRNSVIISSPAVALPTDLLIPSVEQDDREDYIIGSSYGNGYFEDALPSDRHTSSRSRPSPDSPKSQRNRSVTPRSLDRAGHAQLSKSRGVPKSRAAVSKTDHYYPNTRSAAAAKKFVITETSYGEPNRQYSPYRSSGHGSLEQEKLTSVGSVERKVLQLKNVSEFRN